MDNLEKLEKEERRETENQEYKELMELQHNVKIQPELFLDDTKKAVNTFKEEYNKVKNTPAAKNDRFVHYCSFLAHVSDIFRTDLSFLQNFLFELLLTYGSILNPYNRIKVVKNIIMMRNKGVIEPIDALNVFFKLLTIKDKEMRSCIISHIINDIKSINIHKKNPAVNKRVQSFIYDILKNNHDTLAKRAIYIIIELYKRQVWNDSKTVNVIAQACFNENQKVIIMACNFFIETTEQTYYVDSESEDEEPEISRKDNIHSKKTKAKQAKKDREMKKLKRRERRKNKIQLMKNFFPVDMINNPQDYCDRLFSQLKRKTFKFEATMAMMSLLSRMIGRHKLLVLNYYTFMLRYLLPHQKEIAKILAYTAESCHELIPPDELQIVIKHLVEHFVNERSNDDKISMGIRAIREMCEKTPMIMDEFTLNYCAEFSTYKEKNVAGAARSLINYFRDVNPDLLQKKFRGRFDMIDKKENRKVYGYGELKVCERVDGADLLNQDNQAIPIEWDRIMTDEDFKKIKILKRRKMEEEIERRENLNMFNRTEDNNDGGEYDEKVEISDASSEEGEGAEEDDQGSEVIDVDELEGSWVEGDEDEDEDEGSDDEEEEKDANGEKKPKKGNKKKERKIGGEGVVEDWELEEFEESDEENPHGFVSENNISKFRKTKRARKLDEKENPKEKERWYKGPKPKKGGSTNEEKKKNKPLLMLRPKKNKIREEMVGVKKNIRKMRKQLGHVRSKKDATRKLQARLRKSRK